MVEGEGLSSQSEEGSGCLPALEEGVGLLVVRLTVC